MVNLEPYLKKCLFPQSKSKFECGVSGGADSVALMILAKYHGCKVTAHHVNHNIRTENETDFVAELAKRFEIDFVGHQVCVEPGSNLEARARKKRFEVMPGGVATAHTMDDQVETFFINLFRGSSLSGLSGMRPSFSHPILNLRRYETEQIVKDFEIDPFKDPSNKDMRFVRNKIRYVVIPLLNDIAGRDIVPVIYRQMDLMREDNDFLQDCAVSVNVLDVKELKSTPKPIASRALRKLLTDNNGYMPVSRDIQKVLDVVNLKHEATQIKNGVMIKRSKGKLKVEKQ